ncbi:MAG: DUF1761 domain-containing protein [Armatimonadetes bacterium]|nr:MAG: DUF1761 domain-containing protein [Armatimonadota bacterium]
MNRNVNVTAVIVAAVPYILLGYPWVSMFRDPWFHGGGLTVEKLRNGPGYATAFGVAIVSAIVTSYVLALLVVRTGERTLIRGMKCAALVWLAFVGAVMATQYTFEARSIGYFLVTAGYPLVGFLIMGAIVGAWRRKPGPGRSSEQITPEEPADAR